MDVGKLLYIIEKLKEKKQKNRYNYWVIKHSKIPYTMYLHPKLWVITPSSVYNSSLHFCNITFSLHDLKYL